VLGVLLLFGELFVLLPGKGELAGGVLVAAPPPGAPDPPALPPRFCASARDGSSPQQAINNGRKHRPMQMIRMEFPTRGLSIPHIDQAQILCGGVPWLTGKVKKKVDPTEGSDLAQILPPWPSIMRLQIESPIPVPLYVPTRCKR
jgi:hypothetical protein